jgi:group I intron endonuclease
VYEIRNILNNKVYIGSSIHLEKRFKEHKNSLIRESHHNKHLQRAWNKYGVDKFEFRILELVQDKNSLLKREQCWIDFKDSSDVDKGYNISPTAGNNLGMKFDIERRERMSSFTSQEIRDIKLLHRDTDLSFEAIAKIFNCVKGAIHNIVSGINCDWVTITDKDKLDIEKYREFISAYKRKSRKLSRSNVKDIKLLIRENVKYSIIADIFNVSRVNVNTIANGKTYKDVTISDEDKLDLTMYDQYLIPENIKKQKLALDDVKIIKLIFHNNENVVIGEVAKLFKTHTTTVSKILSGEYYSNVIITNEDINQFDMEEFKHLKTKPRKLTVDEIEEIALVINEKQLTYREIAELFDTTLDIVNNIRLKRHNGLFSDSST